MSLSRVAIPVPRTRIAPAFAGLGVLVWTLLWTGGPSVHQAHAEPEGTSAALLHDVIATRARHLAPAEAKAIATELARAERAHGLDPLLILGVIEQESRFDPRAVGPHGSRGLMQVRPFVGEAVARREGLPWSGPDTLYDAPANVRIGVRYLAQLVDMYDDVELALAAYNMGPYRLRRLLARGGAPRGIYAGRVVAHRERFQSRASALVAAAR